MLDQCGWIITVAWLDVTDFRISSWVFVHFLVDQILLSGSLVRGYSCRFGSLCFSSRALVYVTLSASSKSQ